MKKRFLPLLLTLALCLGLLPTAAMAASTAVGSSRTAKPTHDALTVSGVAQTPAAYRISNANYFLLRDVAMMLNGTAAQFEVDYDAATKTILIKTKTAYTPNGTEKGEVPTGNKTAKVSHDAVMVDGKLVSLTMYRIGSSNYFKIRDLGEALGFNVSYDDATKTILIDPDHPYEDENKAVEEAKPAGDPITLTSQSYSLSSGKVSAKVITVNMSDPRVSVRSSIVDGKLNATRNFSDICAASGAVALVNANFFEAYQTIKDPIGHVMVGGEFLYGSSGISSLGITADNEMRYGSPALFYRVKTTDGGKAQEWAAFEFNVLAQFANQSVIYTPARGSSFPVTYPGAVLTVENGLTKDYQTVAVGDNISIPANGFVLYSDTEVTSTPWYQIPEMGRQVTIEPYIFQESDDDFSLEGVQSIVSGGRLVKDGAAVTTLEVAFSTDARFTKNSTPRTAVGTTADGKLLLVSVTSATIPQMRELMLTLGCVEAINLDGGASTAMYYDGDVLVTPGRQLTTTLQVFVSK